LPHEAADFVVLMDIRFQAAAGLLYLAREFPARASEGIEPASLQFQKASRP
jgi:hypothetical protein